MLRDCRRCEADLSSNVLCLEAGGTAGPLAPLTQGTTLMAAGTKLRLDGTPQKPVVFFPACRGLLVKSHPEV